MPIKRGDVVIVNLDPTLGGEIKKTRPCLIIQNNAGNDNAHTTIIARIRDASGRTNQPYAVKITAGAGNLDKDSLIDCSQIRTIDKSRIIKVIGELDKEIISRVDRALRISLDLL